MKREIEKLETALQKTAMIIRGPKDVAWKEIGELGFFGWEMRRLKKDLEATCRYLKDS